MPKKPKMPKVTIASEDDLEHARRLIAAGTDVKDRTGVLADPQSDLSGL